MKKIAAIHDLSGYGKSSLTVVIPILSCFGMQVCPVPTAILSTQTDGFSGYTFLDLTAGMADYLKHWDALGISFDSVYTGYLGSFGQMDIIKPFVEKQKNRGALILIDPVLGDNGSLYNGISEKMVEDMRNFIGGAHIITPNFTEAEYLLGGNGSVFPDVKAAEKYIRRFKEITGAHVIITSARIAGRSYNICFDRNLDEVYNIEFEMQEVSYPGSGDAFASILLARILQTGDFTLSSFYATNRTSNMVRESIMMGTDIREGLPVEAFLHDLDKGEII